jgi:hypothetical protein
MPTARHHHHHHHQHHQQEQGQGQGQGTRESDEPNIDLGRHIVQRFANLFKRVSTGPKTTVKGRAGGRKVDIRFVESREKGTGEPSRGRAYRNIYTKFSNSA